MYDKQCEGRNRERGRGEKKDSSFLTMHRYEDDRLTIDNNRRCTVYNNIDAKEFKKIMRNVSKHSPNGVGLMKFVIAGEIMTESPEYFDDDLFETLIRRLATDVRVLKR